MRGACHRCRFVSYFSRYGRHPINARPTSGRCKPASSVTGQEHPRARFILALPHYGNQGGEPSSIIRQGDWKLIHYYEDGRDELYNLRIDETESEPLNVQYLEKVEFLSKKLSVWLTEVGARYPEPDPQYNPAAEALYKKKTRERMMKTLEATRKKQLGKDFKPNADWWGSETKD